MFNIPKSELIKIIINHFSYAEIRGQFSIKESTKISRRLNSYKKSKLIDFISSKSLALDKLQKISDSYPFNGQPSLYILTYENKQIDTVIKEKEILFPEQSKLVSIIFRGEINQAYDGIKEMVIPYKKRIEYIVADSESDKYGELSYVESLEEAILWFFEGDINYAILATSHYFSVRGLVQTVSRLSEFTLQFPIITESMLKKLQANSKLSNASFGLLPGEDSDFLDVRSLTIFDDKLSDRQIFKDLNESRAREQFSSYMKQNDYVTTGIGLSRRTSKVWTPSKLKKIEVFKIAKKIVEKLTTETRRLDLSKESDSLCYFLLFSTKTFNGYNLKKAEIEFYSQLLSLVYMTFISQDKGHTVDNSFLYNLVKYSKRFGLNIAYEYECRNCGRSIHKCTNCGSVLIEDKGILESELKCKVCETSTNIDDYRCDCGESVEMIGLWNHIFLYPELDTIKEIKKVLNSKTRKVVDFNYFVFSFSQLKIIENETRKSWKEIELKDLKKWRTLGKINTITLNKKNEMRIKGYLNKAKEKCPIRDYHPDQSDCNICRTKTLSESDLKLGNICLLRLYGIAIEEFFDGIHHGNEKADISYTDEFFDNGTKLEIGIHFKSKAKVIKEVGRGNSYIKGVMSQFVYSLYMNRIGTFNFDVIGISIPNIIEESMKKSFIEVSKLFNTNFICLEEPEWLKIMAKAEENIILDS